MGIWGDFGVLEWILGKFYGTFRRDFGEVLWRFREVLGKFCGVFVGGFGEVSGQILGYR